MRNIEKENERILIAYIAALFVVIAFCVFPAYAVGNNAGMLSKQQPVTVNIPLKHIIKGYADKKTIFTFTLTADKKTNPMPEGSNGGIKSVSIKGNTGFVDFGDITYTTPGEYYYTITRTITKEKDLKQDNAVYKVRVIATNRGTGSLVIQKKGQDGKAGGIVYTDKFTGSNNSANNKKTTNDDNDASKNKRNAAAGGSTSGNGTNNGSGSGRNSSPISNIGKKLEDTVNEAAKTGDPTELFMPCFTLVTSLALMSVLLKRKRRENAYSRLLRNAGI